MIRMDLKIGSQELFACRPSASTRWLDGHKDHIEASQGPGIVAPQHPSLVGLILVKQAQTHRRRSIAIASPNLERDVALAACLAVEVESIKDQRTVLRVKDASELLCSFSVLGRVEDIGYI